MPDLTFHPEFERHLTFDALYHCPRHYHHLRKVAKGLVEAKPAGESLLVGIGADILVGKLWEQRQAGGLFDPESATQFARESLEKEQQSNPQWPTHRAKVFAELDLLGRQYTEQWEGIRDWKVLTVHPYEDLEHHSWLKLPLGGCNYLTMPDMIVLHRDTPTVIDFKTGKWAYDPEDWLYEPQLLTYCFAAEWKYQKEVTFQIDYMQRPTAKLRQWVFPPTQVVPFDGERRQLAEYWLKEADSRRDHYCSIGDWPRDPSACRRTRYGIRCEWFGECFGGEVG